MTWFKKKKKEENPIISNGMVQSEAVAGKEEKDGRVIMRDFSRSALNRSVDYYMPISFQKFSETFYDYVQDLLSECNLDMHNDDFADSTIEANEKITINEVERQHIANMEVLKVLYSLTWPAELLEYRNALNLVKQKLINCESELQKLRSIKNDGTVYEGAPKLEEAKKDSLEEENKN